MTTTGPRSIRPGRPDTLGPFEIIGAIAKGGMATLYLAKRPDDGTLAAVKVIRHELSEDEQITKMFLDETALLERLKHPNIVETFQCGVQDERRYIAMELLLGHTLLDVWKACTDRHVALGPELVAWIGARVAEALHFAHELRAADGKQLDLVHRDVNPANVFLTYEGTPKLFDFGLAKTTEKRARSQAGIVKGKLPYLAPEQIMQMPLDRRVDIFSLGTTLWEMVTMRRLFARDTDVDTVKAVRGGPIPDPKKLAPALPEELAAIIRKALERNRTHRHATAAELAAELDAFATARGLRDAPTQIGQVLTTFFPEEHKKQMTWVRSARGTSMRPPPPPGLPR